VQDYSTRNSALNFAQAVTTAASEQVIAAFVTSEGQEFFLRDGCSDNFGNQSEQHHQIIPVAHHVVNSQQTSEVVAWSAPRYCTDTFRLQAKVSIQFDSQ
jgi:hypothetical protein